MGFLIISLIILYELTKTKLESGRCGLMTSTNDFKWALKRWAALLRPWTQPLCLGRFAAAIGLHPIGFTDINTNFLAPKLYNFCINSVKRNILIRIKIFWSSLLLSFYPKNSGMGRFKPITFTVQDVVPNDYAIVWN